MKSIVIMILIFFLLTGFINKRETNISEYSGENPHILLRNETLV